MDTHILVDNRVVARIPAAHLQHLINHLDRKVVLPAVTLLRVVHIILLASSSMDSSSTAAQVRSQVSMAHRINTGNLGNPGNHSMEDTAHNLANTVNSLNTANSNNKLMGNKEINPAVLALMGELSRINTHRLQGKLRVSSFRLHHQDRLPDNSKISRMVNKLPASIKSNRMGNKVTSTADLAHMVELNKPITHLLHNKLKANSSRLHQGKLKGSNTVSKAATACHHNRVNSSTNRDIKEETTGRILSMVKVVLGSIRLIRRISRVSSRARTGRRLRLILGGDDSNAWNSYTGLTKLCAFAD